MSKTKKQKLARTTLSLPVEIHLKLHQIALKNYEYNLNHDLEGSDKKPDSMNSLITEIINKHLSKKGGK